MLCFSATRQAPIMWNIHVNALAVFGGSPDCSHLFSATRQAPVYDIYMSMRYNFFSAARQFALTCFRRLAIQAPVYMTYTCPCVNCFSAARQLASVVGDSPGSHHVKYARPCVNCFSAARQLASVVGDSPGSHHVKHTRPCVSCFFRRLASLRSSVFGGSPVCAHLAMTLGGSPCPCPVTASPHIVELLWRLASLR